jgi:hypothetical protein
MEAGAKKFHFGFTATSPHGLDGIQSRWFQYFLFQLLHPCVFIFDVNNEQKVTINLSDFT